ncbi:MAG: DUF4830 domain-containing protein [Eubacteriales bacterium]
MFIYAVRASTIRFVLMVMLSLGLLLGLVVYTTGEVVAAVNDKGVKYTYSGIRTNDDRVRFLEQFGWQTGGELVEEETFTIPDTFDRVLLGYNEIQKAQGLDLSRYEKKKVTRYTYEITNYEGYEGTVYANLIVYRDKVIAADLCSADPMGFVRGIEK